MGAVMVQVPLTRSLWQCPASLVTLAPWCLEVLLRTPVPPNAVYCRPLRPTLLIYLIYQLKLLKRLFAIWASKVFHKSEWLISYFFINYFYRMCCAFSMPCNYYKHLILAQWKKKYHLLPWAHLHFINQRWYINSYSRLIKLVIQMEQDYNIYKF